jgi:mRNA interferase HicA
MKRTDLIRKLEDAGCKFIRHGGNHDRYCNPKTGISQPIPRHREINEIPGKAHPEKARAIDSGVSRRRNGNDPSQSHPTDSLPILVIERIRKHCVLPRN